MGGCEDGIEIMEKEKRVLVRKKKRKNTVVLNIAFCVTCEAAWVGQNRDLTDCIKRGKWN